MHYITPQALEATLDDISYSRLSSYRNFFIPKDDAALYGTYCWNDALSSCFMRLFGVLEITMRNRFHSSLSACFWAPGVSQGSQLSNDWYNHFGLSGKSLEQIKKMTHVRSSSAFGVERKPPPSSNKVIASLTYGFWSKLLDVRKDNRGATINWGELLVKIIPNHHHKSVAYWNKSAHQDALYSRIELVGDLRNRVAHFEPIWKLGDLKEESRPRRGKLLEVIEPAPANPQEAIKRLRELYRRSMQLLFWLSRERAADFLDSEVNQFADYLMSMEALERYQHPLPKRVERLSSATKSWGGKLKLRGKEPVWLRDGRNLIGRYYPYQ